MKEASKICPRGWSELEHPKSHVHADLNHSKKREIDGTPYRASLGAGSRGSFPTAQQTPKVSKSRAEIPRNKLGRQRG